MTDALLPESLIRYLAARDAEHAQAVEDALSALTVRELRLVKEAAVMGYVRGKMSPRNGRMPGDGAVLREVVGACLANADNFPVIGTNPDDGPLVREPGTVAYRPRIGTSTKLLCPEHVPQDEHANLDWMPVSADDLEDSGICTQCGVDVLPPRG